MKRFLTLFVAGLLSLSICVGAQPSPPPHVINFGVVNERLWRGAEPSALGLEELGASGVKVIVDLRENGHPADVEKSRAETLGMKYVHIPMLGLSAPSQAQIQLVMKTLSDNQSERVFLHCRRGKDRTGTAIACYRIQHDGWENRRALDEAKRYGMSSLEYGMQAFILHFTPTLEKPLAAEP